MKNYLFIIAAVILASCSSNENSTIDLAEKRITQSITVDAMGLIPDLEVISISEVDSVNFKATHTFTNSFIGNAEVKLTRIYTFNSTSLDSIIDENQVGNTMMKVEGEWVDMQF